MTEADSRNYEIVLKDFESEEIEFIKKNNEIWISTTSIAKGLGLNRDNINQSYYRNKHLLESHTTDIKIISEKGPRNTRVFDRTGFIYLCIRSNSPKAIPFQEWVLNVIDEIMKKGYYFEKTTDPFDLLVKQAEMVKEAFVLLKEHNDKLILIENQVSSVDSELKTFEQKYDDEKIITPQTRRKIKDLIHECVKNSGMHWNNFWPKIWKTFGITTTTDISEKLGQKIIKWIKINPYFKQFLNENKEV